MRSKAASLAPRARLEDAKRSLRSLIIRKASSSFDSLRYVKAPLRGISPHSER